jgi:KDO2-lipid IV(A) lauroyltransferase
LAIGESLGGLVHRIGIRVAVAEENLSLAFPDLPIAEINQLSRGCYRHFGALLAEFARLPLLHKETVHELVDFEHLKIMDEALQRGKGGVVVSGHLGNWELMGSAAAVLGYPVTYVVTGQENERVERLMDQLRQSTGIHIIKRRDALKEVIKALKGNKLVAILSDQDAGEAGAFVPFFGRPASTPRGAAVFCLRTGASMIFVESYRQGLGRLKVIFESIPLDDLPEDREEAIQEVVRRYTSRLEQAVRRHPEQWFWMHRRWKTRPRS